MEVSLGTSFVVFVDKAYYPYVEGIYASLEEARARAKACVEEETCDGGRHEYNVYVAEVKACIPYRSF